MKPIRPWKKLSSKNLLNTTHLSIDEDIIRLPTGKEKPYIRHSAGQPHSVIVIALNAKKQLLVQKEFSYPPNKIMWQLPGGSIEPGEDIITGAKRELAEESGYSAKRAEIIGFFYTNNRLSDQKQYVVLCTGLFPYKLPENEDEFIETHWLTKREIRLKITNKEFDNINLLAALNMWFYHRKEQ